MWDLQAAAAVLEGEERNGRTMNGGDKSQSLEIYRMKGVLDFGGEAIRLVRNNFDDLHHTTYLLTCLSPCIHHE